MSFDEGLTAMSHRTAPSALASAGLAMFLLAAPPSAGAQELGPDIEAQIGELAKDLEKLQQDVTVIREILEEVTKGRAAAQAQGSDFAPQTVSVADAPFLGAADAPVTLVEYTDYQCPYCRRHAVQTQPELLKEYVDAGKLKYVVKSFPIASIHPHAPKAAEAALCAGEQDRYFDMHDALFANQQDLSPASLVALASNLGLDEAGFRSCLEEGRFGNRVQTDLKEGMALGVRGTPSFVLGRTGEGGGEVLASEMVRGAQGLASFRQVIEHLLAEPG